MGFWQRREVYMGKDGPQLYAVRTALEQACLLYTSIVLLLLVMRPALDKKGAVR